MKDDLAPSAPSQPSLSQAYTTPGNNVDTDPKEQSEMRDTASSFREGAPVVYDFTISSFCHSFSFFSPTSVFSAKLSLVQCICYHTRISAPCLCIIISTSTSKPTDLQSDQRIPATQAKYSQATPTPMALGVHGVNPNDRVRASDLDSDGMPKDDHGQVEQMQMGAPGEGKVSNAVSAKPGASGAQPGLESDLERKKREQAGLREEVDERQKKDVDVAGVLGQRGGPAVRCQHVLTQPVH